MWAVKLCTNKIFFFCQLTQVDLYNGCNTVFVVVQCFFLYFKYCMIAALLKVDRVVMCGKLVIFLKYDGFLYVVLLNM